MGAAWRKLRWNVAYWISRAGVAAGRYLPTGLCYAASVPIADACFALMRRHRRALEANLARVVGRDEAHAAARRVFRNFARYVIDFYQLPRRGRAIGLSRHTRNCLRATHAAAGCDGPGTDSSHRYRTVRAPGARRVRASLRAQRARGGGAFTI